MTLYKTYTKRDWINLAVLSVIFLIIVLVLVLPGNLYGSQTDWENQHWIIPEYLRNRFYETGSLFPSFAAEAGAGQNIYYYAYYGHLSPLILLSYLFPFADMRTYITVVSIISVIAGVWLFYRWVRYSFSKKISFFLSFMYLTAGPIIFHSHRHIMFVNYMPFLLLLFMAVRKYVMGEGRLWKVTVWAFLLVNSSFYFSVGGFVSVGAYTIMLLLDRGENLKNSMKKLLKIVGAALLAVIMSGILLVPTFMALLSGRAVGGDGIDYSVFIPRISGEYVLYGPYSMGLNAICIYGFLYGIVKNKRGNRFFSVLAFGFMVLPLLVYILNGGLYLDGKALIPFIPLALLVLGDFVRGMYDGENMGRIFAAGTIVHVLLFTVGLGIYEKAACAAEVIPLVICFIIYMKNKKPASVMYTCMVFALAVCVVLNLSDSLVKRDDSWESKKKSAVELADKAIDEEENIYRFALNWGRYANVNKVLTKGYCQASIYSSTCNRYFKDFYLNEMCNDITYRNNAILSTSYNTLYNMYMGVKYYISAQGYVPAGYNLTEENGNVKLYTSELAYPIGYVSDKIISSDTYDKLDYPYNIEALLKYKTVDLKNMQGEGMAYDKTEHNILEEEFTSHDIKKSGLSCKNKEELENTDGIVKNEHGYSIRIGGQDNVTVNAELSEPVEGKLLFIVFNVDNDVEGESKDISITINGIKNKLTSADWKYHNGNYRFEYVVDAVEKLDSIKIIFSNGNYDIRDISLYEADYEELKKYRESIDEFHMDKDKTSGDMIVGDINVRSDGWFHLSVPYDGGFLVTVDGRETEYYLSDKAFIGFCIEKGNHHIEIKYTAPGYKAGSIMSAAGMCIFVLWLLQSVLRRRKRE